jgi:hypothetical protein
VPAADCPRLDLVRAQLSAFVPDEFVDRSCLLGPPERHVE